MGHVPGYDACAPYLVSGNLSSESMKVGTGNGGLESRQALGSECSNRSG
jgi:hypothetical protein